MNEDVEPVIQRRYASVAVVVAITVIIATTLPIFAAVSALRDVRSAAESNLLNASTMAARQADRILIEQFFELELLAASVGGGTTDAEPLSGSFRTVYGRVASLSNGILWFDHRGALIFAEPAVAGNLATNDDMITSGLNSDVRSISMPFVSQVNGHATTALSVPIYNDDGARAGTIVGLLSLTEPLVTDLVEPARLLGPTGHADLVDERGLVLASTIPAHVLQSGDHPDLYDAIAEGRVATVERVAHAFDASSVDQSAWHVMAYSPLRVAPWGVAMGASDADILGPVAHLQRRFAAIGVASLITLLAGGLLALYMGSKSRRLARHVD